ncbi:MAG: serine/threonine-protein kinase, partial [Planctomycetota bacterium]
MSSVSRAEERYAHYLVERDEGRAGAFETWVSSQGELADELRALHARWQAFRPRFEQLVASPEVDSEGAALLSRLASRPAAGARFELRGEVGCGGMGHVQRVFDPELARELALKTARLDQGSAARRRARTARLLAEARITGALQHPGIVPIHELGLDADGQVYYTMPLIAGEDLERLFARVRAGEPGWTRARVLSCLARVCETMAYAHARGVVHGDLKPSNVRVGTFGEVYVMDWGLAQRVGVGGAAADDDEEERGTEALPRSRLFGTPAYLAPEALDPLVRAPDPRSDVFAVGAMLYRLLTGSVPHEAALARASGLEALRAVRAQPLAPLPAAAGPPELLAITARALAVRPEQRYPDMRALAEDLRAFLEDRVVRAHATGPWVELLKWIRRNRAFAGALAALVSSLAGGLLASHSFFLDARASEARTRAERDRVLRLADVKRLTDLEARADELWPALPALEADYVDWLARADELVGRLELHRRTSNELDAAVTGSAAAGPTFVATERQWERDTLAGLVGGLERLIGAGGRLTDVRARLALARGLEERSRGSE